MLNSPIPHLNKYTKELGIFGSSGAKYLVRVEPLATMGQVTSLLNPLGWTLPVVPELDDLTVGGLIMGCGVETSSYKYGLFHNIYVPFELVLADGSVVTCSKEDNPDLFYAVPWSHGTLGFLVSAELQIVKASQYVRIHYKPIQGSSSQQLVDAVQRECENCKNDFVECLVYSKSTGVIMAGQYTDGCEPDKVNVISRF